jgi:hypothetical protein
MPKRSDPGGTVKEFSGPTARLILLNAPKDGAGWAIEMNGPTGLPHRLAAEDADARHAGQSVDPIAARRSRRPVPRRDAARRQALVTRPAVVRLRSCRRTPFAETAITCDDGLGSSLAGCQRRRSLGSRFAAEPGATPDFAPSNHRLVAQERIHSAAKRPGPIRSDPARPPGFYKNPRNPHSAPDR